jgi:hypothetical protein
MTHFSRFNWFVIETRGEIFCWRNFASLGLLLLVFSFGSLIPRAQQNIDQAGRKMQATASATINIAEIERREKERGPTAEKKKIENENLVNIPFAPPIPPGARGETFKLTLAENSTAPQPRKKEGSTGLEPNFPGIGDNNTTIPPDMGGAVGPNHVMTALNSQVRIQNKTGGTISTVTLNGFFSPLVGVFNVFDPKVLYDPFAGRWIITAPANSNSATSALLIAVSSSNDPTAAWTGYAFDADSTNTKWFDYPSIGFNNNWIVVTGNLFQVVAPGSPDPFMNEQIYIFDRVALYAGASPPTVLNRPTSEGFTICPAVTLDSSMAIEYLVSNWNGSSGGNGYVRLYTITGTPAAPVYTVTALLPNVALPWASSPNATGADFAPQSGAAQLIQNNDSRMQNVVFQNGSLWCAQSAYLPVAAPTRSAVQWWQINPTTAAVQQFGRVDDATATNFYAFPSIGVNAYNDVLIGYSSYSAAQFASCNYSFRMHTDALNTLQPTVQFKAGLAKYFKIYSGTRNRWGDYSSTCIDPNNFGIWTIQEYAELPSAGLDGWGTEWNLWVPPVSNLFMKDVTADVGAEPDLSTLPMYESDDIWVRKFQDAPHAFAHITENAEYRTGTANPNYVYVDVRNRGAASSAGTEQLTLYWAKAGAGLSWPDPWNGGIYYDPGPNTMLMGNVIGTVTLPVIASGGDSIQEFAWNPPNSDDYATAFGGDQNHFCILARITTSTTSPFGMTFLEDTNLYGNVQKNNHIVWKNIGVYNALPGTGAPAYAVIANLTKQKMVVKVKFSALDAAGNAVLLDKGTLRINPSARLKEILKQNRPTGEGFRDAGDGTYQINKEGGFLQNISLDPGVFAPLEVVFVPNNPAERLAGYAIRVEQVDQTGGTDHLIGGQTLVFGTVQGFGTSGGGGEGGGGTLGHWPWWWWLLALLILLIILWLLWRLLKK